MYVKFRVPGQPIPKQRPRRGRGGHFYTPKRSKVWEEQVGYAYVAASDRSFRTPVMVVMMFDRSGYVKADIDNMVKSCLDGLNNVAWKDDEQVRGLIATLSYGADSDSPGVTIIIQEYDPEQTFTLSGMEVSVD